MTVSGTFSRRIQRRKEIPEATVEGEWRRQQIHRQRVTMTMEYVGEEHIKGNGNKRLKKRKDVCSTNKRKKTE